MLLQQNSQEQIKQHQITEYHHEYEEHRDREVRLVEVDNLYHYLIPILACQNNINGNQ